jgi:NADH dehydrogenase
MEQRILILGAGYGGLLAALEARNRLAPDEARITVVNKHSYHQLVTLLHETAVGARPDRSVRLSLAKLLDGKEIELIKATVQRIDVPNKTVWMDDGSSACYDQLVVGLGSEPEYFGIAGMKDNAFVLKSVNQARLIRAHIEQCFARYMYDRRPELLRFVVGGAGFSGIELVGELADALPEMAKEAGVDYGLVELYNVEAMPGILPGFDPELTRHAELSLTKRGVRLLTGVAIVKVDPGCVHLKDGRSIEAGTIIWTGGVRGNQIVVDAQLETDPRGRAKVDPYLRSVSDENVFVVGDCAFVPGPDGRPLPPTAQLAWQMGVTAGRNVAHRIRGSVLEVFTPANMGSIASLGRRDSVGKIFKSYRMRGRMANLAKEASEYRYLAKIGSVFGDKHA